MKNMSKLSIVSLILTSVILSVILSSRSVSFAQNLPDRISYEGGLEFNGEPLTQSVWMEFRIYDAPDASGINRYTQRANVPVSQGRFTQLIGPQGSDGSRLSQVLNTYDHLYLEVVLLGDLNSGDDDITLSNRQRLTSSPYSVFASHALNGNPAGIVQPFAGATLPQGWLWCDGSTYNSADYPELASVLGVNSGTFSVPDLRGYFIRGLDPTGSVDPQFNRQLGGFQADSLGAHNHTIDAYRTSATGNTIAIAPEDIFVSSCCERLLENNSVNLSSGQSNETRPKNVALNYIIKH